MKKIVLALAVLTSVLSGGDYEDGLKAYNNEDYKHAVEYWEKAAERGDTFSQYALGNMYRDGQ